MPFDRLIKSDGSSLNVELQENCTRHAVMEGFQAGGMALALSTIAIFGGIRLSPGFGRSLSVSAKTALIVSPAFGAFFLYGELAMAECATANRHLQRTAAEAQKRKELAAKMRAQ